MRRLTESKNTVLPTGNLFGTFCKRTIFHRPIAINNLKSDRVGCYGLDQSGSGWGPVEGSCEHGIEPSGFVKYWEILE